MERQTRFAMLVHLPDGHGALAVRDGLLAAIKTLPAHLCKTLTWDQGTELAQHRQITMATKIAIYFCDPHSPCSEGRMRTRMACCASTFRKVPTCQCTHPSGYAWSPPSSTTGHARL